MNIDVFGTIELVVFMLLVYGMLLKRKIQYENQEAKKVKK